MGDLLIRRIASGGRPSRREESRLAPVGGSVAGLGSGKGSDQTAAAVPSPGSTQVGAHAGTQAGAPSISLIPAAWQKKTGKAGTMIESFYHAFHGVVVGLRDQRNLRIHFAAVGVVSLLAFWLKVDAPGWIALTVAMALVIAAEFLNTALEHMVDMASGGQYHKAARDAKDTGAAAVLVASIAAAIIGAIVFVPRLISLLGSFH